MLTLLQRLIVWLKQLFTSKSIITPSPPIAKPTTPPPVSSPTAKPPVQPQLTLESGEPPKYKVRDLLTWQEKRFFTSVLVNGLALPQIS